MSEKKTDIIGEVAKEIDSVMAGLYLWWREKSGDERSAVSNHIAVAAILSYDAAKGKAEEPYVTRVEKGVTYWSNGLCSQETPDYMKHETSVVTMPDGVQYKATWSDFGKVGGPTLKIEKQP